MFLYSNSPYIDSEEQEMAKRKEIRKGDVVVLKSGGPKMTVQSIGEPMPGMPANSKWIHCIWFEGNVINEYNFDDCVLNILEEDKRAT